MATLNQYTRWGVGRFGRWRRRIAHVVLSATCEKSSHLFSLLHRDYRFLRFHPPFNSYLSFIPTYTRCFLPSFLQFIPLTTRCVAFILYGLILRKHAGVPHARIHFPRMGREEEKKIYILRNSGGVVWRIYDKNIHVHNMYLIYEISVRLIRVSAYIM